MFIIDGMGILNVQYFGQKNAKPEERIPASDAAMYFIRKMIKDYAVTHMVVVLDCGRDFTFRRKMYADYKANRPETEPGLRQQREEFIFKLQAAGIPILMSQEFEADDYAGTLVKQYSSIEPIILISKDQDYLQLVNENTYLWLMKTKEKMNDLVRDYGIDNMVTEKIYSFTPEMVKKVYGLEPRQIIDLKALNGDSSDNIPGVKGLGKAALSLLQYYGDIEDMYLEMECVPENAMKKFWKEKMKLGPAKYNMLQEQKDMAFLSKKLATIYQDIPLIYGLEQYRIKK